MSSPAEQRPDWRTSCAPGWARALLRTMGTPVPWATAGSSSTAARANPDAESLHPRVDDDWHSSAHMQWAALVLLREAPTALGHELAGALTGQLRRRWRGGAIPAEADQLRARPDAGRPLGWAWTAMLAAEARRNGTAVGNGWDGQLGELAEAVSANLLRALASMDAPVRLGTDRNTAFCAGLLLDAFEALGADGPADALRDRARTWFCGPQRSTSAVGPCANDICSPALAQADLARRVLPAGAFDRWLADFLPRLGSPRDPALGAPVHRDGAGRRRVLTALALTRALHLRHLAPHLPRARAELALGASERLVDEAAPLVDAAPVTSAHLLVPLAVLAVAPDDGERR